jgi:hypothetical protein
MLLKLDLGVAVCEEVCIMERIMKICFKNINIVGIV